MNVIDWPLYFALIALAFGTGGAGMAALELAVPPAVLVAAAAMLIETSKASAARPATTISARCLTISRPFCGLDGPLLPGRRKGQSAPGLPAERALGWFVRLCSERSGGGTSAQPRPASSPTIRPADRPHP